MHHSSLHFKLFHHFRHISKPPSIFFHIPKYCNTFHHTPPYSNTLDYHLIHSKTFTRFFYIPEYSNTFPYYQSHSKTSSTTFQDIPPHSIRFQSIPTLSITLYHIARYSTNIISHSNIFHHNTAQSSTLECIGLTWNMLKCCKIWRIVMERGK